MMTNHDRSEWEFKGSKYVCEPGQFVTSLESIKAKCGKGITIQNIRTALVRFEKFGFLTNESTKHNRLITIINWGDYQGFADEPNKATNSRLTNDQQTTNKQLTTNKNERMKNVRNKEKKKYTDDEGKIFTKSVACEIRNFHLYETFVFKFLDILPLNEILDAVKRSQGQDAKYLLAALESKTKKPSDRKPTEPGRTRKPKLKIHKDEDGTLSASDLEELKKMASALDGKET